MNLEDQIRTAIKKGGLLSVALYPSAAEKGLWVCTYLNDSGSTRKSVTDKDPIEALRKGISPIRQPGEKVREAEMLEATSAAGKKAARKRDLDDIL